MALNVPYESSIPVRSLADSVAKWSEIDNQNKQVQLQAMQEQRMGRQAEQEAKSNELKFNAQQRAAHNEILTAFKIELYKKAKAAGIQEGTRQFQDLANATYMNYDKLMQNTGIPAFKAGTDIDLNHIHTVMTPDEMHARELETETAKQDAMFARQKQLAEMNYGHQDQADQRNYQQSLGLESVRHKNAVDLSQKEYGWRKELEHLDGTDEPKLSEGELINNALDLVNGGTIPRNIGKANSIAILNTRDKILNGEINPDDVRKNAVAQKYENKSQAASLKTQVAQENAIKNMERLFDFNREKLSAIAKSLNNDTSPFIQEWLQTGVRNTTMSPDDAKKLAAFDVYKNEVDNEYAKITSGSASGAGVIAQSEREHVRALIKSANTLGQMQAALDAMGASSRARMETLQKTKAETMAKLGMNTGKAQQEIDKIPDGYVKVKNKRTGETMLVKE